MTRFLPLAAAALLSLVALTAAAPDGEQATTEQAQMENVSYSWPPAIGLSGQGRVGNVPGH